MTKDQKELYKSKETNTFRFKSFADRVNEIDIRRNALYYIGHENEELPEGDETYFHQTLKKWIVLNLTDEYNQFSRQCIRIVTLPQLLHQKDFVIDLLLEKLSIATNLSLQPLLELLVVLGRDLREEFYNYFQRILDRLICLLHTKDADQLEWTLVCLAFLFKTLKPFLRRNIDIVFNSLLPLLDDSIYSEQVTNFAVECFAFIARDIRDYDKLLEIVLGTIEEEQIQSINGCGRLFFEICRGVSGRFHSVTEGFLRFLLSGLLDERWNHQLLFEIVKSTVRNILQNIHPHNMTLFWAIVCEVVLKAVNEKKEQATKFLILLKSQVVQWKDGRFLSELESVVSTILKIVDGVEGVNTLECTSELICRILLSPTAKVSQLDTSRMIRKIMHVEHRDVFESFVWNIADHSQFELLILPDVMKYFERFFDERSLRLLARIVLKKSPLLKDGRRLEEWKQYPLLVKSESTLQKLNDIFEEFHLGEDVEKFLLAAVVAPHMKGLDTTRFESKFNEIIIEIMDKKVLNTYLTLVSVCLETAIHLKITLTADFLATIITCTLPLCIDNGCQLAPFKLVNQIVALQTVPDLNLEALRPFLSSSSREIRLLTAHSLKFLYPDPNHNPYTIFYAVESIEPTVHTYRDQLLLLQKLEPGSEFFKAIKDEQVKVDCLRFLLGLLYHNFKLLWEPVLALVEEYAKIFDLEHFWDVYKAKLEETVQRIGQNDREVVVSEVYDWLHGLDEDSGKLPVDFCNYRNLLWRKLASFGHLAEKKNRDLVTMFLDFVNNEYRRNFQSKVLTWNVGRQTLASVENEEEIDEHNGEEEDEENMKKPSMKREHLSFKVLLSTLSTKLSIFVSQPNPKALYREPELYAFYLDLLSGTNPFLQKLALDCILAYKNKSITPYKDHLYAMIDDKRFKDEMVNFKVHREANQVQEEHRPALMEVLLRILYGKMTAKQANKTAGSQVRKGVVLRFLGGCEKDEIFLFLRMAFGIYDEILSLPLHDIPTQVSEKFNPEVVWSPRKLQSTINLLEIIRQEFGGLMDDEFLMYLLKIITFVGAVCNEVIYPNNPEKVSPKVVGVFKTLKNLTLLSLCSFFNHFDNFPWTDNQILILSDIFVWGTLEKLPQDSIHSPTPLLKLLFEWGQNVKLYKYLAQQKGDLIPFKSIVELLLNDRAKIAVRRSILQLVERLLVDDSVDAIGIEIVKPYIGQILKRLKMNFSTKAAKRKLDKRDLNILSLLTNYVEDAETCDSLLQLLLPILVARTQTSTGDEVIGQVITTLSNLVKRLNNPEDYLRKIAPLFEHVQEVSARKMLCQLLVDIAKIRKSTPSGQNLKDIAILVSELNAWDRRWVEQPDYDKRIDALRKVARKLDDGTVDLDLGVLVIFNCFYFVKYDKDMGLRDNASEHLKLLAPKLVTKFQDSKKDVDYLVGDVLLNLVRRTIRDNSENVRNEGIGLLGELARKCSNAHQVLLDLSLLADSQDAEVDFFENITHLQSHRHGRALLKFCSVAKSLEQAMNYRTLTQFVLPLASRYLCNEKHAGKHTLVDAAIETVGVVCQLLPWSHYQTILKFYLQKMRTSHDYQKQCVRIVVAILDAFHFDLSSVDSGKVREELKRAKEEAEKREKERMMKEEKDEEEKDEEERKNQIENEEDEEDEDEIKQEDLDSEMDEVDEDEEQTEAPKKVAIYTQSTVLPPNAAKKVIGAITTVLIPTLNHSITEKSSYDRKHKLNRKRLSHEREEEEILRVPIGLALVKLLQKLPKEILENSLPGVFMKVCTFLKSPLKSVRLLTRDILRKIMLTLGGSYLSLLLDHLTTLLTRGFQVHVLSVTVHGVLDVLKDQLQPGDIDSCLKNILEVCLNDIFGEIAAEKEVDKIGAHTPEARASAKSYLVLHIAARNIQESCLLDLLLPFKDYLAQSQSRKMVLKIQDCFQKIVSGLVENKHISRESLLIFIYGTMSESITDLLPGTEKRVLTEKEKEKMRRQRADCFIIPEMPRSMRSGIVRKNVKNNAQANAHILIEFGLEMLHIVLKRKKLNEIGYEPFLTPLLPLLRDSLKSSHVRVTTFALKCVAAIWNNGYELSTIGEFLPDIVERIFEILHSNSTFGTTKQDDNFHLVKSAFKSVVALLRKCAEYSPSSDQIAQLILYIEHDLHESQKQPMAFSLLKAIVARKVVAPEIHDIIKKLAEISITSQSDYARDEARTIVFTYVMEYEIKQKVEQILKFYTTQLNFAVASGRLSAVKFLSQVAKKFPPEVLARKADYLFLSLGTRLVNEDQPECRLAIAASMEAVLAKINQDTKQKLFDMTLLFFDGKKPSVREMAACLVSRFVEQEKEAFTPRVKVVLPVLVSKLSLSNPDAPGRFVRPLNTHDINNDDEKFVYVDESFKGKRAEMKQRAVDHELIQTQNCVLKIFENCPDTLINAELSPVVDELAYQSQHFLSNDHEWVRVNSAKTLALILSTYDFNLVGCVLSGQMDEVESRKLDYIYLNPAQDLKSLVLDLCAQMIPGEANSTLVDEAVKIFLLIANMLRNVQFEGDDKPNVNLYWLIKRLKFVMNNEVAKAPHSHMLRSAIINWIEGLIMVLEVQTVEKLSPVLLSSLVREMSEEDQNIDMELRQQAIRVGGKLRKRIGAEIYDKLRSAAQGRLMMKRAERKKQIAMEKINEPERAAKRKLGVQERKKAAKKRKTDVMRGKVEGKRKRKRKAEEDIF